MKTNKNTGDLEAFLAGELKEGELWEFNKRLEADLQLQKEVQLHREINQAISDEGKWALVNTLEKLHRHNKKSKRITLYSWKTQAVAASIVFFIMVGSLLTSNYFNTGMSNEALYNNYFDVENTLLTTRSEHSEEPDIIQEGLDNFADGNYELAIQVLEQKESNMMSKLYIGFSHMKLEDYDKAIVSFKEIIEDNNNLFTDQAEWNLGLCYLVIDDTKQAKEVFTSIAKGKTTYKKRAQEILLEIR